MTKDKRASYIKEEIADVFSRIFKGKSATSEEIEKRIDDPRNQKDLQQLHQKIELLGSKYNRNGRDPDHSGAGSEGIGIGVFSKMLTGDYSRFVFRTRLQLFGFYLAGVAFLALVVLLVAFILIQWLTNFLIRDLPEIRETAPEAYCATVYRLNDTHKYHWCDDKYGLKTIDQADK